MFEYAYARPAASVDLIVPRQIDGRLHLLLIQRKHDPYAFMWALPGGFMEIDETLEQAAARELKEETGLIAIGIEQLKTFSRVDRDPRSRVITTAFVIQTDPNQQPVAADDARDVRWVESASARGLAFDHDQIVLTWTGSD
jgi:8-oxo-dGTP diphosphatase